MKRISGLLIIIGILIAAYPIADRLNTWYWQTKAMEEYQALNDAFVAGLDGAETEPEDRSAIDHSTFVTEEVFRDDDLLMEQRENRNIKKLPANEEKKVKAKVPIPLGILVIDKINLEQPIFEGASQKNLKIGVGHMTETSAIGEIGNAAIAGHRSHTFGRFFNRLDELDINDQIIVEINKEKYQYTVFKKIIVEPSDISVLNRNKRDKVLTLITCHPLYTSSHRLIIHAKMM